MQSFRSCWRAIRALMILPLLASLTPPAAGQCELNKLLASDGVTLDHFGGSVSISGSLENKIVLVGVSGAGDGHGAAYIFRFEGAHWTEEAKLLASDGLCV